MKNFDFIILIARGWNIYQREWLQGKLVKPEEYRLEVRRAGAQWAREPPEVKEAYQDKAEYEQCVRNEAMKQPLLPKSTCSASPILGSAAWDAASELNQSALKKLSKARLVETYRQYADSEMWHDSGLSLASADGCLRLDLIDVKTCDKDILSVINSALHESATVPGFVDPVEDARHQQNGLHHETCVESFGHCKRKPHTVLATRFVKNFNRFLSQGASAMFVLALECSQVLQIRTWSTTASVLVLVRSRQRQRLSSLGL